MSRKVCVQRYAGHPGSVTTAFFGGFKSLLYLQYNHPARGHLKEGCSQMSLVGIVSNTSKDVVGLPWDLQCDTPVTLSPNYNVTCSAFLFNSSMGKDYGSRCPLPISGVSPAEVGASLPGWHLKIPVRKGVMSELLGCSWKFCDVSVPPFQPAGEPCCLARLVPAWISGSHAWLS